MHSSYLQAEHWWMLILKWYEMNLQRFESEEKSLRVLLENNSRAAFLDVLASHHTTFTCSIHSKTFENILYLLLCYQAMCTLSFDTNKSKYAVY